MIEGILEEHHEDASPDDLVGLEHLEEAIRVFNEAQVSGSYFEDRKCAAVLEEAPTNTGEIPAGEES